MIRSKDIAEYFPAELTQLKPDTQIPFDLYLYFPQNKHLIHWRNRGERLHKDFLERYSGRNLDRIWIHRDDKAAFLAYTGQTPEQAGLAAPTS
ncbi:MAG TPA: hypothetical protein VL588_07710, partial [Bdellovibrionota bacterium]|nr:hypothetical protein [Bdellovibrionota bacterium]